MPDKKSSPGARSPAVLDELTELAARARGGDASALPRLRQILDENPEIWEWAGDLDKVVVRSWVGLLAGDDPLSAETVRRKAEQLQAELEGDEPTPLERLLVGQVVACWLETSHAQLQTSAPGKATLAQAGFHLRRAEMAQRKYLAAVKTLTSVRALVPRGLLPVDFLRLHEPGKKLA